MSVIIKGKETYIIDRTLMNITGKPFNENELHEFTVNLRRIGVDFFEVDARTFNIVRPLITSEVFIFRIDKISQLEICKRNAIEYILVKEEDLDFFNIKYIEENYDFKIILEIDINFFKSNFMNKINRNIDKFFCLRFKGESNWLIGDYINENYNVKTSIYASDKFSMATAVAFGAILKEVDYITTTFCGKDGTYGTTALEEILVSTKVIMEEKINEDISILCRMRRQYERIVYSKVPNNKPVIGKNIFKYESGVHVAGIEKNPITYEPFNPEIVGMKRKLALGKHSGKNSVRAKLKELHLDNNFSVSQIVDVLEQVKSKSIQNKMELSDEDFIDICKKIERTLYV